MSARLHVRVNRVRREPARRDRLVSARLGLPPQKVLRRRAALHGRLARVRHVPRKRARLASLVRVMSARVTSAPAVAQSVRSSGLIDLNGLIDLIDRRDSRRRAIANPFVNNSAGLEQP